MLIEIIIVITLILTGAVYCARSGYKDGVKRKNTLFSLRANPNVDSNDDSIEQARMIGRAIEQRAAILNNSALSTRRKLADGKHFNSFAFDNEEFKTDKTSAFLEGKDINLIKFCRLCHSHGVRIELHQIGLENTENKSKKGKTFISRPEATLFLKN